LTTSFHRLQRHLSDRNRFQNHKREPGRDYRQRVRRPRAHQANAANDRPARDCLHGPFV
jgi:hypothetical protein